MNREHVIIVLVQHKPGVLNKITSLLRRRRFNIKSVTDGPSVQDSIYRITIVVDGSDTNVEQVIKQLYKLIEVVKISDVTNRDLILRELAFIKIYVPPVKRQEVIKLAEIFSTRVTDVSKNTMILEIVDNQGRINSLVETLRPYGIKEISRSGMIAMTRDSEDLFISRVGKKGSEVSAEEDRT